jgi:Fe-S-cluster containining protein
MEKPYEPTAKVNKTRMNSRKHRILELALDGLRWTDDAIQECALRESLNEPLACKPGCHYCCFNQPMATPPEALLVGHYVEQNFTDQERRVLLDKIEGIIELTNGESHEEIVKMRYELPCIFLKDGMCSVYDVRPAVCRTCSSTDAEHCRMIFESKDPLARLSCYPHMRQIFQAVHTGLLTRCHEMRCQSEPLQIAEAIRDYFNHPSPIEAWIKGEMIFHLTGVD